MKDSISRRKVLAGATAAGVFNIVPRSVLGGKGHVAANDRLALAHIAMGTQSFSELGWLLERPEIQIVAVCDPNRRSYDYIEWGKDSVRNRIRKILDDPSWGEGKAGCPGGREIGQEVVNAYYAKHRSGPGFRGCAAYEDFRELLEKENDIDAVKVMTPDHLHATVAIAAMKRGRHVVMHKPIANRLYEGRLVLETARETGKETSLLAYGSGRGNGEICAAISEGAIGRLREVHNWTNRPVWPQYPEIPRDRPPAPEGFNWDLWLGPATDRPYHPHYTHTVFRGWYDFGGGSMADMGIYSLWPVFNALDLDAPLSAEAHATHTCAINDGVSQRVKNDFSYPAGCMLRFRFAAKGDRPEIELFWYDGGMKPRLPEEVEKHDASVSTEGILFVGDRGSILAGFHGDQPRLFADGKERSLWEEGKPPGREERGIDRNTPWLRAFRGGESSPGSFLRAGAITDAVNLGAVALRAGTKVLFDSEAMKITNVASANQYLRRQYREGWDL